MPVALEYRSDHLLIRLVGSAVLSSLRRVVVVPYSDIERVDVEAPRWPPAFGNRLGTHLPGYIASGTFMSWKFDQRRFLHFERSTQRVLTLRLAGHPSYEEISIDVRDPEAAQAELGARRKS